MTAQIPIVKGSETAARAIIAGLQGVTVATTGGQQMVISIAVNDNGQPATSDLATALASLQSGGYIEAPDNSTGGIIYGDSTTTADGETSEFAFDPPVSKLLTIFLGGIPQLATDASVTGAGTVLLADSVTPPSLPVTALYIAASA